MSRTKKRTAKGSVEGVTQQTPCKESCPDVRPTAPTKANKIALGISLTLLLAWIAFLAVLAVGK